MVATTLPGVLLPAGTHAARPAASAVASGTLYPCTTHALIYQSDGASTWTTWATLGTIGALTDQGVITYLDGTVAAAPATPAAGKLRLYAKTGKVLAVKDDAGLETVLGQGIADQGAFTYLDATDGAAPANPAAGHARIYSKSGRIYSRDSSGTEYGPFDAAGAGAGPLLYVDSLTLHASGDDFADTSLTGWTLVGVTGGTAVTTELYDATCLDITFAAQSDRMYKTVPSGIAGSGNYEISLTVYGMNNDGASPVTAAQIMCGLYFSDNSGNGTGFSMYNDSNNYLWGVTANAYSASGSSAVSLNGYGYPAASGETLVYKLKRVGTTITGSLSLNGGVTWYTATRTDSTTFTRMGIIRLFNGGGTNPRIRVGRFNVTEL